MSSYGQSRHRSSTNDHRVYEKSIKDKVSQSGTAKSRTNSSFSMAEKNLTSKNAVCIGQSEIERMRDKCLLTTDSLNERKHQERQELHELSKQRVKNWPNTLNAIRKKKDETKFERFQKDEEERRRVDEEEAIYQAQIKRGVIEKANKQIYEGSDRVKAFQAKLLLVDALQEREGQIELKQQMKQMDQLRDEIHVEQVKENIRKMDEVEIVKKKQLEEKKAVTQRILKEQHDEMKVKYIKKAQEEKIEGEIIKSRAIEAIAKEKEAERLRREKAVKTQQETQKGNEHLKELRAEQVEKEKREDEKIKEYAEKKDKVIQMRKLREEMRLKEKQDERQKLIDAQVKELSKLKDAEESRLNKQIEEAQMKADQAEKKKREAIAMQKQRFDESIQLTLKRKEQQQEKQKIEDVAYQTFWAKKNVEIQAKEKQEKQEAFDRAKNLQDFHKTQTFEKQKIREKEFLNELDEAERIKQRIETDDKTFNSWAERMIREWNSQGKDIKPLLKELATYGKKV